MSLTENVTGICPIKADTESNFKYLLCRVIKQFTSGCGLDVLTILSKFSLLYAKYIYIIFSIIIVQSALHDIGIASLTR